MLPLLPTFPEAQPGSGSLPVCCIPLQVITLEGWVEIMYYVMDAHSFYNFIYFILLIIVSVREAGLSRQAQGLMGQGTGPGSLGVPGELLRARRACWERVRGQGVGIIFKMQLRSR